MKAVVRRPVPGVVRILPLRSYPSLPPNARGAAAGPRAVRRGYGEGECGQPFCREWWAPPCGWFPSKSSTPSCTTATALD
jgi:hypothetical protein